MATNKISVNRAPVLTLWATVVAQRLGYNRSAALTLGKALAGLNAQSKGQRLGIYHPTEPSEEKSKKRKPGEESTVLLMGRPISVDETKDGIRASIKGDAIKPEAVQSYLERKFGPDLAAVEKAMQGLAGAFKPSELGGKAYSLYETFRPEIPAGARGWGAQGELDLSQIRAMGKRRPQD